MDKKLKETLIDILTYFRDGLEDVKAGTENNEEQPMLKEIKYALPLVKNLNIADVSGCAIAILVNGSKGHAYEDPTDGCYLCKFGDEFGRTDGDFCKKCKLETNQYYR